MPKRDQQPILVLVLTVLVAGTLTCSQGLNAPSPTQTPYILVVTPTVPQALQTLSAGAVSSNTPAPTAARATPTPAGPQIPGYKNVEFLPNDVFLRSGNAGADIVQALAMGGMGGGGGSPTCDDPDVLHAYSFGIDNCSIEHNAGVHLELTMPDGTRAELQTDNQAFAGFHYCLHRGWSAEPGTYAIALTSQGRTLRGAFSVNDVLSPTIAVSRSSSSIFGCDGSVEAGQPADIFFFGFEPGEPVKVILYNGYTNPGEYTYSTEWTAQMDQNGRLLQHIEAAQLLKTTSYTVIAIGRSPSFPYSFALSSNPMYVSAVTLFDGMAGAVSFATPLPTATTHLDVTAPQATPTASSNQQTGATSGSAQVLVPAGSFLAGAASSDTRATASEKPQITLNLSAFSIDRVEVSVAEFQKFVAATGYRTAAERGAAEAWVYIGPPNWLGPGRSTWKAAGTGGSSDPNYPVGSLTWSDAQAYCRWAGGDLPSAAQWEKAARGTDGRIYPWGGNPVDGSRANFADQRSPRPQTSGDDGFRFSAPADSFHQGASPYGALNMAGNLWEWVLDNASNTFYRDISGLGIDPVLRGSGDKMLRGGSWWDSAADIRITNSYSSPANRAWVTVGMRCAYPATP